MDSKRSVEFDGRTYKVRRAATLIPDLDAMDRIGALIWLNRNTYAQGHIHERLNPLAGLGDVLSLGVR